ncbi:MAG: TolC family protein [Bacteroidaceae bacterium]
MKSYIIILLFSLMALPAVSETLTVEACRQMALEHNHARQSAAFSTTQALHTQKSVWAQFFPSLSLEAGVAYDTGDGTMGIDGGMLPVGTMDVTGFVPSGSLAYFPGVNIKYDINTLFSGSLLLKQPLYMGGKIRASYQMSKMAVELYRQGERKTEAEVLQSVDDAYAKVVKAREMVLVAQRYKALLEELDRNVESAVRHGLSMRNDRLKVGVRLDEVELQLRKAENAHRLACMNLCHVTGMPLDTQLDVSAEYPQTELHEAVQTSDVSLRPESAMLDYQTRIASEQVRVARSDMLPSLSLMAKYGYTNGFEVNGRRLLDGWNFGGGVTLSVPLYHFGTNTQKVKAAKVKLQMAQEEQADKREMMLLELQQAANNLDEARLEVTLAENSLVQAEENMQVSQKQYQAGMETLSDCLEAQAAWQKANENLINAQFRCYLAIVDYRRSAGLLVP